MAVLFYRNMKTILHLVLFTFLSTISFGQNIVKLDANKFKEIDKDKLIYFNISENNTLKIEEKSTVLIGTSVLDLPQTKIDSMLVTMDGNTFHFSEVEPFLIDGVDKNLDLKVQMFQNGKTVNFQLEDKAEKAVSITKMDPPVFKNDTVVFGLLMIVLGLIFYTANKNSKGWKKFYTIVPALLLCYLIPAILDSMGLISTQYSGLYKMAKNYLLPAALILMTIGIDFKGVLNLGPKALIMFFTATIGIVVGGPIAIMIYKYIDPAVVGGVGDEATWKGMATLAGSWIGGGANQAAMLEMYGYKQELYGKMITVDIVVAQLWMIFLLWGASRAEKFDRWLKADVSAIEDLKDRVKNYEAMNTRKPTLTDYIVIAGLTFGLVGIAHYASMFLGPYFESILGSESFLASNFFWLVVISTVGALVYSATKVRMYEGAGASKLGSMFIYILVATIGMKMNLGKAFEEPQLIVVGIIWMLVHVGLLFLVAKLIKAPFFFLAVGSKANVGGAASAPVIAAAFHPSLASVGVLLAVLGYGVGSIGAIICAELMAVVAP